MDGKKILLTGPTSTVGLPVALDLAADNEVWGIARFGNAAAKERLEAAGVRCVTVDITSDAFAWRQCSSRRPVPSAFTRSARS